MIPVLVVLLLLVTGCAPLAPLPGQGGSQGPRTAPAFRDMARRHGGHMPGLEVALVSPPEVALRATASELPASQGLPPQGCQVVPPGWPDLSSGSEELLAPFLACTSPADFIELQGRVDMPRVVEAMEDWEAVRLGALGPVHADAAAALNRKRAAFLVTAAEKYGLAYTEVFALFIIHSAFDDELREVLLLLARDKRLGQTLGRMEAVRQALEMRGVRLSDYADRAEQPGDVLRGLGRAARDALSSSPASQGARYTDLMAKRGQLPPPYQWALDEVEKALMKQHFSPGNVLVGSLDDATLGVPLGFYQLVVGTGQGVQTLARGQYEQATRELAPAALLVGLYAAGKRARPLSAVEGAGEARVGPQGVQLRLTELKGVVERLVERLGGESLGELARYIQSSREAALFVGAGGEPAAVALYEARGNVARAQAWLSQARPERASPTPVRAGAGKSPGGAASLLDEAAGPTPTRAVGGVVSLVDEAAGLTPEVVEAKLLQVELESTGARLSGNVAALEKQRPSLEAPPPGAQGHPLWGEYVTYWERRLAELKQGNANKPPLAWEGYERMRGLFARGLAFERAMVELLRADAALPRALRRFLQDFDKPRIETYVGVAKEGTPGIRFADVLVIEEGPLAGRPPRVETFSFKSRNLALLEPRALVAQLTVDASEALRYYGETLNILRHSLKLRVQVQRVRLIYEGGELKPKRPDILDPAVRQAENKIQGVEVLFQ